MSDQDQTQADVGGIGTGDAPPIVDSSTGDAPPIVDDSTGGATPPIVDQPESTEQPVVPPDEPAKPLKPQADPGRLRTNMPPPAMRVNPVTGMVAVVEIATGKMRYCHAVDVKEQLAFEKPQIRLADESEAPTKVGSAALVDYDNVNLETLRGYAQDAGITFNGKTRDMLAKELNDAGFIPPAEGLEED